MVKISVLMPVYKTREEHLREAIESILAQTFSDFEFLILDDCPEDSREKIVRSYSDSRIKYFKNERNLGISATRNKLLSLSKGEYLAVFDHDDISLPKRFEKQAAYLDAHPYVGVVSCWRENFPKKKIVKLPVGDDDIKRALMEICALLHPAAMIRKSVLNQNNINYEAEYTPCEDYRLWLRLLGVTRFYNIPEVLFKYRWHGENASIIQKERMFQITRDLRAWAKARYPATYQRYLDLQTHVDSFKLFGIFPILTLKKRIDFNTTKIWFWLFGMIPILFWKKKRILFKK